MDWHGHILEDLTHGFASRSHYIMANIPRAPPKLGDPWHNSQGCRANNEVCCAKPQLNIHHALHESFPDLHALMKIPSRKKEYAYLTRQLWNFIIIIIII